MTQPTKREQLAAMRRKAKRRNAWLITWEATPSYRLKDLGRPRVVAILKPQLSGDTIKKVLPILFTSESRLTFTDRIGISFFRQDFARYTKTLTAESLVEETRNSGLDS